MKNQEALLNQIIVANSEIPLTIKIARKKQLGVRQVFLLSRIVVALITVGLLGYTVDRFVQSIQKPSVPY